MRASGSSGDLPPSSPPAEKANTRQDQAGKASTHDGAGDGGNQVVHCKVTIATTQVRAPHELKVEDQRCDVGGGILNTDKNGIAIRVAYYGFGPKKAVPIEGLD